MTRTHVGQRLAERLAEDIRTAPRIPPGNYNCPADDGSDVDLYFHYARRTELVTLSLSGCEFVGAPGRFGRTLTRAIAQDLAAIAPAPWTAHLPTGGG